FTLSISSCTDGMQDGDESGTDCGGPVCAACAGGQACNEDSDCSGGACDPTAHTCVDCGRTAHCSDGFRDCGEVAADCGGADCSACIIGCCALPDPGCFAVPVGPEGSAECASYGGTFTAGSTCSDCNGEKLPCGFEGSCVPVSNPKTCQVCNPDGT